MVVGEFTQETELLVIGGGPGGYSAAFRAAELGIQTTIVDPRDALGGVCLHTGCVPSKTLLHIADTIRLADRARSFGVAYEARTIDPVQIRGWVQSTVATLARGLEARARQLNIERISGVARFEDEKHVAVSGGSVPRIKFRRAIIATGSHTEAHPDLPFDGARVLSPEDALRMIRVPERLLVIGCGYMAVEVASIFSALGSAVTLASEEAELLSEADGDIVRPLHRELDRRLDAIELGAPIDLSRAKDFDQVVVATGQSPNVEDLNLAAIKVGRDEAGYIVVDEHMRTDESRIFAVGDVTAPPLLASRALAQGRVAAEVVAGRETSFDARVTAHVVFTDPQLAWCGLTEREATSHDIPHTIVKLPWGHSGRAVGMGRAEGLTKLLFDHDSRIILGVGIAGVGACEMIAEAALAIEMGAELTDIAATIHPHPTVSELLSDIARAVE